MKTVAKKEGDDYVINGSKIFISNAGVSDVKFFIFFLKNRCIF
jgi:alkylation response protein AidB-like acyl-CoA dehydrogenase